MVYEIITNVVSFLFSTHNTQISFSPNNKVPVLPTLFFLWSFIQQIVQNRIALRAHRVYPKLNVSRRIVVTGFILEKGYKPTVEDEQTCYT